jgi:hypothetical protein
MRFKGRTPLNITMIAFGSFVGVLATTTMMAHITMNNGMQLEPTEQPPDQVSAIAAEKNPEIDIQKNHSPKTTYDLVLTFDALPGELSDVSATADYVVDNVECVPPLEVSGARLRPEHSLPLTLHRIDNNRFATSFDIDALVDQDYFGLGVCRWVLNWATVRFASPTTRFVGAIATDQMQADKPLKLYYLASDFNNAPDPDVAVFGEEIDIFAAEAGPRFTLTLTASEASK